MNRLCAAELSRQNRTRAERLGAVVQRPCVVSNVGATGGPHLAGNGCQPITGTGPGDVRRPVTASRGGGLDDNLTRPRIVGNKLRGLVKGWRATHARRPRTLAYRVVPAVDVAQWRVAGIERPRTVRVPRV